MLLWFHYRALICVFTPVHILRVAVEVTRCGLSFTTPCCSCKSPRSTSFTSDRLITSWLLDQHACSSRRTLHAREDPKGWRSGEHVGVTSHVATGVLMYRSGPASAINNISQPFLAAYVSPWRFSSITNSAADANKRAPRCQIKIYWRLFCGQNFTWKKTGIIQAAGEKNIHFPPTVC